MCREVMQQMFLIPLCWRRPPLCLLILAQFALRTYAQGVALELSLSNQFLYLGAVANKKADADHT